MVVQRGDRKDHRTPALTKAGARQQHGSGGTKDTPQKRSILQVHPRGDQKDPLMPPEPRFGRTCTRPGFGHARPDQFNQDDITIWKRETAPLIGIKYAGLGWSQQEASVSAAAIHEPQTEARTNMATQDNLQAAFAGESQASQKYLAFAAKAGAEGLPQIAKLFRAAAAAETVHAQTHLRVMGGVGDTRQNVQAAIDGEKYEFNEMYRDFIQKAEAEGNRGAVAAFRNAMAVERLHHDLYAKAMEALAAGKDLSCSAIHVCDVCGNTVVGEVPDNCPVCGAPKSKFKEVA